MTSEVIDFAKFPAQRFLAGNSFFVRCHVTLRKLMRACTVGEELFHPCTCNIQCSYWFTPRIVSSLHTKCDFLGEGSAEKNCYW